MLLVPPMPPAPPGPPMVGTKMDRSTEGKHIRTAGHWLNLPQDRKYLGTTLEAREVMTCLQYPPSQAQVRGCGRGRRRGYGRRSERLDLALEQLDILAKIATKSRLKETDSPQGWRQVKTQMTRETIRTQTHIN